MERELNATNGPFLSIRFALNQPKRPEPNFGARIAPAACASVAANWRSLLNK
jgi:hypothetical protein